jgi:hypothetical protein
MKHSYLIDVSTIALHAFQNRCPYTIWPPVSPAALMFGLDSVSWLPMPLGGLLA